MSSSEKQTISRRNHYLPVRYQLGFADDGENVWVYDRQTDRYRVGHPRSTCFINDFYTTERADGGKEDEVEKCLAFVENATWPIIDRLDRREPSLTGKDRANLALFAALLRTRVPAFDKEQNSFADDFFRWWAKVRVPNPEAFQELRMEAGCTVSSHDAMEAHRLIHGDDYVIENPRQNNIKMMLELALTLSQALLKLEWGVLWSPKDYGFVTSDNPFVIVPPSAQDPTSGIGVMTPGALTAIPLSSRTLLFLKGGEEPTDTRIRFGQAPKDVAREINMRVTANSDRFVIARDEAQIRRLVSKTKAGEWRNAFQISLRAPSPDALRRRSIKA